MKRFLTILCLLLIAANAFADRAKVGVVLCGGGAKGAAHVGVLKVLEENEIPIDFIVGTSMGSIIGGLYAIGYTADELDTLIMSQDWTLMMSDRIERDKLAFEKKRFDDEYVVKVPFGFDDYSRLSRTKDEDVPVLANIPMAMVNGQNLYNLFTKLSVGYQDSLDFNKMPIPFACVAVDLVKKEEYVFHSGRFVDAIRSSMAIPGYFAPMRLGDRVLVDGGVLNNFPVDVAREMGADIIIGVNLGDPSNEEPTISNIGDIFNELLNLVRKDKERAALESTDILIVPDKGGLSTFSFDTTSLRKLIDSGEAAARDKQQELAELKERIDAENYLFEENFVGPVKAPATYKKAVHLDKDTITVGDVIVNGLDPDDARYLLEKSCFKPAARLNGAMIDAEITRLYNTDAFESVTYLLKGTEEPYDLELNFTGNRRSVLGLGFRFDLEEIASILLKIGLNKNSLYGSQLSFSAKLAYNMQTNLEYAYVFRSLAQFNLGYRTRYSNLNTFNPDAKGNLIFLERSLYAGFSTKRFRNVHTNFGVQMDFFDYKSYISGSDILPIYNPDLTNDVFASGYLDFEIDKRDDFYYPTKGFNFSAGYNYYISSLSGQTANNFGALKTHLSAVASAGKRVSVIISGDNRTLFGGNIPMAYMNIMGGTQQGRYMDQQLPFIGFNYTNVFSNILSVATIDVRTQVMDNHYLFASASLAHDCTDISSFFEGNTVFGTRLGYSYNSAIGPIALFANWSDYSKSVGMGFSIGYSF